MENGQKLDRQFWFVNINWIDIKLPFDSKRALVENVDIPFSQCL